MIGDSGLRLNGNETIINDAGHDLVTASLRQEGYRIVGEAKGSLDDQRRIGRALAYQGCATLTADMHPWLDEQKRVELRRRCLDRGKARFPGFPAGDIERLLDGGIARQEQFQNNTISPFSYAVLDCFGIPMELVRVFDRPRSALRSIELFTDGYFKTGVEPSVDAWEAAFQEVEKEDPEKIDRYPSVKGSMGRMRTDDRTVVVVHL